MLEVRAFMRCTLQQRSQLYALLAQRDRGRLGLAPKVGAGLQSLVLQVNQLRHVTHRCPRQIKELVPGKTREKEIGGDQNCNDAGQYFQSPAESNLPGVARIEDPVRANCR